MEIILRGGKEEIEIFLNEVFYPIIRKRQGETLGHYFRITEDPGEYWPSRKKKSDLVRIIRGYFPRQYYPEDFYAGKYTDGKDLFIETKTAKEINAELQEDPE